MREKGFAPIIILLFLTIFGLLSYLLFTRNDLTLHTTPPTTSNISSFSSPHPSPFDNSFDNKAGANNVKVDLIYKGKEYKNVKVGDGIENLTITKKRAPYEDDIEIVFEGVIIAEGAYYIHRNEEDILRSPEGRVCMESINDEYQKSFPRLKRDERILWFCFDNQEYARKLLSTNGDSGNVIIKINNYRIVHFPSTVWNSATLIEVLSFE